MFLILSINHFAILKVLASTSCPRILKKSSLELFFNVLLGAMDENRGSNRTRELSVFYCPFWSEVKLLNCHAELVSASYQLGVLTTFWQDPEG